MLQFDNCNWDTTQCPQFCRTLIYGLHLHNLQRQCIQCKTVLQLCWGYNDPQIMGIKMLQALPFLPTKVFLQSCFVYTHQPKTLVTSNIHVNRMAMWKEGDTWKHTGWGSVTGWWSFWGSWTMGLHTLASGPQLKVLSDIFLIAPNLLQLLTEMLW